MEALRTQQITRSFSGRVIIEDISIHLRDHELVSLLGVSGAGKTTLFNVISGILPPDSGQVLLHGEDVTGSPGKISYMLQKDLLLEHMKVIDNVSLPLRLKGISKKDARAKAKPLLEAFGLEGTQDSYPSALSGGMRQRAALLRTYLGSQGVALLDEPFSALDGGKDGFELYRLLFRQIANKMNRECLILCEIEYRQRELALHTASEYFPNCKVKVFEDLAGQPRILQITNEE